MRWAGYVALMEARRGTYRILVRKPKRKRPLGRPKSRLEDNIKMDLHDVGWGSMGWTDLAQERGRWRANVNAVVNIRVPQNPWNFLTSCESLSFSRMTVLYGVLKDHLIITVTAVSRAVKPSSCPH